MRQRLPVPRPRLPILHELDRDNRIGSFRDGPAGRDRHRLAGPERYRSWSPGRNPRDHGQAARRIGSPEGEPVHRRASKRRQVDAGVHVLGEESAGGALDWNQLGAERPRMLEHESERLVDREKRRHRRVR